MSDPVLAAVNALREDFRQHRAETNDQFRRVHERIDSQGEKISKLTTAQAAHDGAEAAAVDVKSARRWLIGLAIGTAGIVGLPKLADMLKALGQ